MSQGAAWNNALAAANTATKKKRKPVATSEHPERVLMCLDLNNPLRKWCLKLVEWKPFEYLILTCILLNCVALGANTPYPNKDNDITNEQLVKLFPLHLLHK
jgi:voltage-dependent calcium channel L type alpha-1D